MHHSQAVQTRVKTLAVICSVTAALLLAAIGYTELSLRWATYCMEQTKYGGSTDRRCLEGNRRNGDYWQSADDLFVQELWLAVPATITASAALSLWLVRHNYKKFADNPPAIIARHRRVGRALTLLSLLALLLTSGFVFFDIVMSAPGQYSPWGGLSRIAIFTGVPVFLTTNTAAVIYKLIRPKG